MPATILASMRDGNRVRQADKHEGEKCNRLSLSSAVIWHAPGLDYVKKRRCLSATRKRQKACFSRSRNTVDVPETKSPGICGSEESFSFMISRSDRNPPPRFVSQAGYGGRRKTSGITFRRRQEFLLKRECTELEIQIPLCY